jgi:Ulp1 family protease
MNYSKIFIPINIGNTHWSFVILLPQSLTMAYFCSYWNRGLDILEHFASLFNIHIGNGYHWKAMNLEHLNYRPLQTNGVDCGVFVIETIRALAFGGNLTEIDQDSMLVFRGKLKKEIEDRL